jgi:hypothetical protein
MAADGGAADVELQLGRRQPAALHHRLEDAQQAQLGVAHLPQQGLLDHESFNPLRVNEQ